MRVWENLPTNESYRLLIDSNDSVWTSRNHGNSTLNSLLMRVKAWHVTQQCVLMGGKEKGFPSLPADTTWNPFVCRNNSLWCWRRGSVAENVKIVVKIFVPVKPTFSTQHKRENESETDTNAMLLYFQCRACFDNQNSTNTFREPFAWACDSISWMLFCSGSCMML